MSLKGKLTALAGAKIAEKVIPKGSVDGVVNSVLNKLGQATGQKTAAEHIQGIKKNFLVIKSKSYSIGTMVGLFTGKTPDMNDYLGRYQIVDGNGTLKYKSNAENTITDREILDLFDANGNKIGYVKKHLISTGVPLFEKEVKKCTVFLGKEKIALLKKYVSFGNLEFEVLEGSVKITHQEGKSFKIQYKGKQVATLHDCPLNLKDGYADKFVMEYDNSEDEVIAILLATAIDLINT